MIWLSGCSTPSDPGVPLQSYIPNYKVNICLILSHCKFFLNRAGLPEVGSPQAGCLLQLLLCSVAEEILVVRVNSFYL